MGKDSKVREEKTSESLRSGIRRENAGRKHTFLGFDLRGVVKLERIGDSETPTNSLEG